jgi:hypothetical protein
MKRAIALLLVCIMILSGCEKTNLNMNVANSKETISSDIVEIANVEDNSNDYELENNDLDQIVTESITLEDYQAKVPEFNDLSDKELLRYIQDNIYHELINEFDNDEYYIENINAIYVSKEYLEEVAFNSQSNIFFGYTLDELDAQFQGTRYVFTLGDDGTTDVEAFEAYEDIYERVIEDLVSYS